MAICVGMNNWLQEIWGNFCRAWTIGCKKFDQIALSDLENNEDEQ